MGRSGSCKALSRGVEAAAFATAVLLSVALAGCQPNAIPAPPADEHAAPPEKAGPFRDTTELLQSIEAGTFAQRAGIEQKVETAGEIPGPVEVEFEHGSQVPADQVPKLAKLARRVSELFDVELDLVGCSDPSGSAAVNRRISQARARSVAAKLRELGLPDEKIGDVEGHGEDCDVQQRMVLVTAVSAPPKTADAEGHASS